MNKVILITGASSGMGLEAAKLLAQENYKVYAGARRVERIEALQPLGIIPVQIDLQSKKIISKLLTKSLQMRGVLMS